MDRGHWPSGFYFLEISTRCGDDSDCNAATACGILGTLLGYSHIPDIWKAAVSEVEDIDFKYTDISLNDIYSLGYKLAFGKPENEQCVYTV